MCSTPISKAVPLTASYILKKTLYKERELLFLAFGKSGSTFLGHVEMVMRMFPMDLLSDRCQFDHAGSPVIGIGSSDHHASFFKLVDRDRQRAGRNADFFDGMHLRERKAALLDNAMFPIGKFFVEFDDTISIIAVNRSYFSPPRRKEHNRNPAIFVAKQHV